MSSLVLSHKNIYKPNDIDLILKKLGDIEFIGTNKKISYANIPCSFDIETSSFKIKSNQLDNKNKSNQLDNKVAIMYEWTLCLDGYCIIGRYWEEFLNCCKKISNFFDLDDRNVLIIYVHNLNYEFQFIRKRFDWFSIFSLEKRKPVKAKSTLGIEFRCSYHLSGYSLDNLSNQLAKYKIRKLNGYLDYSIIRNSKTKLTKEEKMYCVNDCLVVVAYIQELIEREGDITKLPLTKTGFVRNACRNACYHSNSKSHKFTEYRKLMHNLILDGDTYLELKRAFAGGFTHASLFHSSIVMENVDSFDFSSSYPYVICSEKFPMSKPEHISIKSKEEFKYNLQNYCCLFDIIFTNIRPKLYYENYISKSKCWKILNYEENNGRVIRATELGITLTEQDFFIISKFYDFDRIKISNFKRFIKDYLPKDFILFTLRQYKKKTELKGLDEKIIEYSVAKENVNSLYGMTVTDICRDEILYNSLDLWDSKSIDIDDAIAKYNNSIKRFLYYPWGVWITAYARRNLFTGIIEFGDDYIYSDTDSIKVINYELHTKYIEEYNKNVIIKLKNMCKHYDINFNLTCPKNIKGDIKQLGIWERETEKGVYTRFKTLGAKRYLVEQNGKYKLTVSGLSKDKGINYMLYKFGDKIFEEFNDGLYIPPENTGKLTHTYIDEEQEGDIVDYQGNLCHYHELSSTHLEPAEYNLSLSDGYAKLLLNINTTEV